MLMQNKHGWTLKASWEVKEAKRKDTDLDGEPNNAYNRHVFTVRVLLPKFPSYSVLYVLILPFSSLFFFSFIDAVPTFINVLLVRPLSDQFPFLIPVIPALIQIPMFCWDSSPIS